MKHLGFILCSCLLLLLILKYIKVIYDIFKKRKNVEYSFKFNVNLKGKNKTIILISSIVNILLLSLALYFYITNKGSIIMTLACSLFVINISATRNFLSKNNKKKNYII